MSFFLPGASGAADASDNKARATANFERVNDMVIPSPQRGGFDDYQPREWKKVAALWTPQDTNVISKECKALGLCLLRITEELRNQYNLGYTPEKSDTWQGYHKILLLTNQKDLVVRTRDGYNANE